MIFSSTVFLFLFLPAVLILNFIIPKKYIAAKNLILLAASLVFYSWGEPKNVLLMLGSIVANYLFGILLEKEEGREARRKLILIVSLIFNLGLLFVFKYLGFFTGGRVEIALPIGISFFTFQIMSYTIDVYRRKAAAPRSILKIALYISLFPQLIAGPIVRYVDVEKQLSSRECTAAKTAKGIVRFSMGLAKKVVISNTVSVIADTVFAVDQGLYSFTAWVGIVCYALQIYYDFSGYSDMAIGIGHMLGFDFLENFNYPYVSSSVREFWRRWHISLSSWFRDYLYIPLGGNRRGAARTYLNLLIVFIATGFWHGASFNFIVWGLYYGVFLIVERIVQNREKLNAFFARIPKFVGWLYTMTVVLIGWVFFRADDLPAAVSYLGAMFSFSGGVANGMAQFSNLSFFITAAAVLLSAPVFPFLRKKLCATTGGQKVSFVLEGVLALALVFLSVIFLTGSDYNPFIYFRF